MRFIAIALLVTIATAANAAVSISFSNDHVRANVRLGHSHTVRHVQHVRYVSHCQPVVRHCEPRRVAHLPHTLCGAPIRWVRCNNGWRGYDYSGNLLCDAFHGRVTDLRDPHYPVVVARY